MKGPEGYPEEDWLALSGIQHFSFCKRQWALIHIEQLWSENYLTTAGHLEHERAHDYAASESRGDTLIMRDLRVYSRALGITGACDVVEFHKSNDGVPLHGRDGLWLPYPIEYKHGKSKTIDADRLQLCAEAMCLEEMLACDIPEGALFYRQTKRRERVKLDEDLRNMVEADFLQMHDLFSRGWTPKVKQTRSCSSCSLRDLCLPELRKVKSAKAYIEERLKESGGVMKQLLNTLFVMTEDAYLALENDNVVIHQNDKTLAKVPLRSIEGIMCFSYKGASPALMGRCGKLGVSMAFYSPRGHYYCSVLGEENRNVLLRREQFRVADDEQKSLCYAKSFIVGKLYNAKWVLERTKRDHALRVNIDRLAEQSGKLSAALLEARKSLTVDELRGVEGLAAKDYFYAFDDLVLKNKDDFFFTNRSRRPPLDRLNALLSFCYSILTNDCIAALQGVGLDPYVGFMHTDRPGRASLALDLVEEFRPVLADRFVLTLVNTGAVKPGDFEIRENGGVLLSDSGRKKVLTAWQKKKSDQILHPFLQEKISWGLVPYVQALLLARSLRGDLDDYPPFMWK